MSTDTVGTTSGGLFDDFKKKMGEFLEEGISTLENEQAKINKAFFEALTLPQRDTFCCSLDAQHVKPKRIEKITGKSQPTINRHLNKKNS